MRRLHVREHENVLKRLLIQVSAFNLGMLMRQSLGVGTPRGLQGRICALRLLILSLFKRLNPHSSWNLSSEKEVLCAILIWFWPKGDIIRGLAAGLPPGGSVFNPQS